MTPRNVSQAFQTTLNISLRICPLGMAGGSFMVRRPPPPRFGATRECLICVGYFHRKFIGKKFSGVFQPVEQRGLAAHDGVKTDYFPLVGNGRQRNVDVGKIGFLDDRHAGADAGDAIEGSTRVRVVKKPVEVFREDVRQWCKNIKVIGGQGRRGKRAGLVSEIVDAFSQEDDLIGTDCLVLAKIPGLESNHVPRIQAGAGLIEVAKLNKTVIGAGILPDTRAGEMSGAYPDELSEFCMSAHVVWQALRTLF